MSEERMRKTILVVVMLLLWGMNAQGIVAQSLEDAEGLETAYSRSYSTGSANTVSAPSGTPKSLESESRFRGIEVLGMTFESNEHAEQFVETVRTGIQDLVNESESSAEAEISDVDLDHDGFLAIMNVENTGVNAIIMFVDGNQVFLIDVTDPDRETATTLVNDVASLVADAEGEDEDVTFNDDGTSTGGVFDRMPEAGSDLMGDLTSVTDAVLQEAGE
jgi:hypothetical protein